MNCKRVYLEYGQTIKLVREGSGNEYGEWVIGEPVGEGASSVCYTAMLGNKSGRLKQLNPIGKSVNEDSINEFLSAYRILDSVKNKNPRYGVLNNYIPYYEILFEKNEEGLTVGTYIWTPDDKTGKNFEDYIKEVRKSPRVNSERKLYEIVSVIATLTDAICLMHMAGLLHLDIKSSNFLVTYNSRMELNTGNISLFDVNTLYSVESGSNLFAGTEGFTAPEVEYGRADNRSDIYSIGAILYNAIVISEDLPDEYYHGNYYEELDKLIEKSVLFRDSSINSKPEVRDILTLILKKCLNKSPSGRYDYCELLIQDLEEAKRILGNNIAQSGDMNSDSKVSFWRNKTKWVAGGILLWGIVGIIIGMNAQKSVSEPKENVEQMTETVPEAETEQISITEIMPESADVTPHEAGIILARELESGNRTVTASYELLGNREFSFEGGITVPAGVTLIIPDDMRFLTTSMDDCFIVMGTLKCNPNKLFNKAVSYGNSFIQILKGSRLVMDDIEVYGGDGEFWASAFLTKRNDLNPNVYFLEVFTDTYVSSSAQELEDIGIVYTFPYGFDEISIYFGDSEEPYETFVPGPAEKLQRQIEIMVATGGEIVVDYPVTVKQNKELWVHSPVTVILKEGGVITLEEGANLFVSGTIIEDGGKIENPARATLVDDGEIK